MRLRSGQLQFRRRYLAVAIFLMIVAALLIVRFNATNPIRSSESSVAPIAPMSKG